LRHAPVRTPHAVAPLLLALVALLAPTSAHALSPDTLSAWHLEVGAGSDVTNERYYEDAIDDTTFSRRLVSSPEYRNAGMAALDWTTHAGALGVLRLRQEVQAGDHLLRAASRLETRRRAASGRELALSQDLEARRDRSFGADQREFRWRPDARLRQPLGSADRLDFSLGAEVLRSSGSSEALVLDRDAGRAWLRWAHLPSGSSWEVEAGLGADARSFPDSTTRDHIESHATLGLRGMLPAAGHVSLDLQVDRRVPRRDPVSTRDRFWGGRADLGAFVHVADPVTLELAAAVDGFLYDRPDTSAYFDYRQWTLQPSVRWALRPGWSVSGGSRLEWLTAPSAVGERYHEVAAVVTLERLGGGDWWSLSPSAGRRIYERSTRSLSLSSPDARSSYGYLQVEGFGDLELIDRLHLRMTTSLRLERHEDDSQDASSLYLAAELRRRF
jgi:hypothetical protein